MINLQEFSLSVLNFYVQGIETSFWSLNNEIAMNLVATLVDVMESKKPRLVKPCTIVLKELKKKLGSSENLLEFMTTAMLFKHSANIGKGSQGEEVKEGGEC